MFFTRRPLEFESCSFSRPERIRSNDGASRTDPFELEMARAKIFWVPTAHSLQNPASNQSHQKPDGLTHLFAPPSGSANSKKVFWKFFHHWRAVAARWSLTAKNIVSAPPLVQPQRPAQKPDHKRPVSSLDFERQRSYCTGHVRNLLGVEEAKKGREGRVDDGEKRQATERLQVRQTARSKEFTIL